MLHSAKDYFELFDLPVSFAVDLKLLTERYHAILRTIHADRLAPDQDGLASGNSRSSIQVEAAYRTLVDPLARAEYLLSLHPLSLDGHFQAEAPHGSEGSFLMEQMEQREALVAATQRPDPAEAVAEVMTRLAEQSAALDKELQGLLADPSPRNLYEARGILRQLQFLGRCQRDAEDRRRGLPLRD